MIDRRMALDRSWRALFSPGDADSYFGGVDPPSRPAPESRDIDPARATWLAELSRLAYQRDASIRARALAAVGLAEHTAIASGSTTAFVWKGRGESTLVFRGTSEPSDWRTNLRGLPAPWAAGGEVHRGFGDAMRAIWPAVTAALDPIDEPLYVAGHSLGGALACLAASLARPAGVYTFGAPRVGDRRFRRLVDAIPVFRVVNGSDVVPTVPPGIIYRHAGRLFHLAGDGSLREEPRRVHVYEHRLESLFASFDWSSEAPEPLSDHAPVNYVERLRSVR